MMMNTLWITLIGIFIFGSCSNGQSEVEVDLIAKKYVERGSSLTLVCKHNVEPEKLYKVTWLKAGSKVFEFINGRDPPYRNFSIPGAEIDFSKSNQHEVTLKHVDFDAAGLYFCEVSLESPIFTKASNEEQVHVILPQNAPPTIVFKKRQFYIGEKLVANCTTSRSKPVPHITWLINGKKVDEIHTKTLHPFGASSKHKSKAHHERNDLIHNNENGKSSKDDENDDIEAANNNRNGPDASHRQGVSFVENNDSTDSSSYKSYNNFNSKTRESNYHDNKSMDLHKKHRNGLSNKKFRRHINDASHQQHQKVATRRMHPGTYSSSQLSIEVSELHAGSNGRLEITCLSTIPASVSDSEQYADYKTTSVKVDIEPAELTTPTPMGGMAALGNQSNKIVCSLQVLLQCLPVIIIFVVYQ